MWVGGARFILIADWLMCMQSMTNGMHADMSAEIFEVPAPERINNPIWLAYLGGVNVGCQGTEANLKSNDNTLKASAVI